MIQKAAEAMGIKSLPEDIGISCSIVLKTDAAAALGVVSRRGIGKMRHINTQEIWMQYATRNQEIEVQKIDGDNHIADILTKNVQAVVLEKNMAAMRFRRTETAQQGSRHITEKQISAVSSDGERCGPEAAAADKAAAAMARRGGEEPLPRGARSVCGRVGRESL